MEILDSGQRREFTTGAVRDINTDKGRCDLLPLSIVGEVENDVYLVSIEKYIRDGDRFHLVEVIKAFAKQEFGDLPSAMLEVSKHFAGGCEKYGERNWERGIPLHCYIDSAVRHYMKYQRGDADEPHHRAFLWNLLCALWTQDNKPEMCDLPFNSNTGGTDNNDA